MFQNYFFFISISVVNTMQSPQTPKAEEKKQLRDEVIDLHNVYLGILLLIGINRIIKSN